MTQELHVLKCFSCETFQSHIVKKTNKWECKICGTKQSIKKVYGRGSGKDCRLHTQKLNALRGEIESNIDTNEEEENKITLSRPQFDQNSLCNRSNSELTKKNYKSNKWCAYIDEDNKCTKPTVTADNESYLKEKNKRELTRKRKRQSDTIDFDFSKDSNKCSNLSYHTQEVTTPSSSIYYNYDEIEIKKGQFTENSSNLYEDNTTGVLNEYSSTKSPIKKNKINNVNVSTSLKWTKYLDTENNSEDNTHNIFSSNNAMTSDLSDNSYINNICVSAESNDINMKKKTIPSCNNYLYKSKSPRNSFYSRPDDKIDILAVPLTDINEDPCNVDGCTHAEEGKTTVNHSLPIFEQDCDFKDCDFDLDF